MRRTAEKKVWRELKKKWAGEAESLITFEKIELDLSVPGVVIGGRNGAGKSRFLRSLTTPLKNGGLLLDLHFLCEQALIVLRSRDDFADMAEDVGSFGPDDERRKDVQRIIGREYDFVEWYALDVEPSDEDVAKRFCWGGEQPLLPYFTVQYRGVSYSSREMGLGEFSIHLLFWILEQYRDVKGLTLLLDEPDAYLPPVGASALLGRLLNICLRRGWKLIIATHSSEMISAALDEQAFVLLRTDEEGAATGIYSRDDPTVADDLLAQPPIRYVIFVEDESASALTKVLVEKLDRRLMRSSQILWGKGSGYMTGLQKHLPRSYVSDIGYIYLFDGDKRNEVKNSNDEQWPALFLPTSDDPDELFQSLRVESEKLAERLSVPKSELERFLDSREGADPHDWVNDLGDKYERQRVLRALAELWVENNNVAVELFLEELRAAL